MSEYIIDMNEDFAFPKGFEERMKRMLGEDFNAFCAAYSKPRRTALRLNRVKDNGQLEDCVKEHFSLSPVPWARDGFYVDNADISRPGLHPLHEAGAYYIQEASAMISVSLAPPIPGERVLDLCAAPGGKSTQIASHLCSDGLLVANEIHPTRAAVLSSNIERMGIKNALVTNEAPDRLVPHFSGFFDRIFVDAPCSGEGMFRKEEAALKQWSQEYLRVCAERQLDILDSAAKMLAPGGHLIYSTCTFAPEENECVIAGFLIDHPEFEIVDPQIRIDGFTSGNPLWAKEFGQFNELPQGLEKCVRLFPHLADAEGHFAAVLRKHEYGDKITASPKKRPKKNTPKASPVKWERQFEEFARAALTTEFTEKLLQYPTAVFGNNIYSLPCELSLDGLRVLRAGLHLGEVKGNSFLPSHALALAMNKDDAARSFELTRELAAAYVRGETISAAQLEKGWTLLSYEGVSLGFGKVSDGIIKNHYPKGLRRNLP
jgi:NOL1/NOP2/sun family putative RNA methylase